MTINKFASICGQTVIIVAGAVLGLSYIMQKELVIQPQSPILGYALIAAVVGIISINIRGIIVSRKHRSNAKN